MPTTTMQHEDEYRLPKGEPFEAILETVKEETYPYTNKAGEPATFSKWVWEFAIVDGEYAGLHAWGETPPKMTNREDNKVRHWAHALTGVDYDLGDDLDTDDLLQLPCQIVVDNIKEQKKGTTEFYYKTPVVDVYPSDIPVEPPF